MFDDQKFKSGNSSVAPSNGPEDIFSKVAGGEPEELVTSGPGVSSPLLKQPINPGYSRTAANPTHSSAPPPLPSPLSPRSSGGGKIVLIIIMVLIAIAVIAVGGWFVYAKFIAGKLTTPIVNINSAGGNVNTTWGDEWENINTNGPVAANNNENININNNLNSANDFNINTNESSVNNNLNIVVADVDTDHDGLTDAEESQFGTDPTKKDTDGDGLYDRTEVKIYCTNPKNPDTDGDSYLDGEEVKNHYNPNGLGKMDVNSNLNNCNPQSAGKTNSPAVNNLNLK